MEYRDLLKNAAAKSRLCVGIDPVMDRLPEHLKEHSDGLLTFIQGIIRATAPYAGAFKPNLAFFEALGRDGDDALEVCISTARTEAQDAVLIGDGKRGDIGSTAERYAEAIYGRWGFDAATVNPWFGADGVLPFSQHADRGVYLLAATSNPSSVEVQEPGENGGEPLHVRIARLASEQWNEHGNIGLVVGATRVETMQQVRSAGHGLPWLIPGVGVQGGDLEQALEHGVGSNGLPSMINASRSIIYASSGEDFAERSAEEAKRLMEEISSAVPG
jgi:orotidine-5'-phosphate decarboxylase